MSQQHRAYFAAMTQCSKGSKVRWQMPSTSQDGDINSHRLKILARGDMMTISRCALQHAASAEAGGGGGEEPVASPHRRKIARQSSGISDPVRSLAIEGTGSGQGFDVMERSNHKCISDRPGHLCTPSRRCLSRQPPVIGFIRSHAQLPSRTPNF
jgi:hypothetical protein